MSARQRMARAICVALFLICFKSSPTAGCDNVILSSESGWVRSPNHTADGSKYCLLISSTPPFIYKFTKFELDPMDFNWLVIFNGPTEESFVLTQGSTIPTSPVMSTSNQTLIVFTSWKPDFFPGFNVTTEPHRCQYELTSETGWFTSPNHPYNYPPNADCSWLITAKNPIILSFAENTLDKCCDVLTIYDGPTNASPVLGNSTDILPSSLASTANQMLITFTSSSCEQCCAESRSLFNATYSAHECQFLLSSESGQFSSKDVSRCKWLINAKEPITLSFFALKMTSPNDSLTIYDGPTESSDVLLKSLSNETIPSSIRTSTNNALIVFTSDEFNTLSSFDAIYSHTKCEYVLSSDSGWFTSPNHPVNYPNNANCNWIINATQSIKLSFNRFQTEEYFDWITIYDGPAETSPVLFKSSGSLLSSVFSSTNQVLVNFISNDVMTSSGFNVTYEPSKCQYISSPDSGWFASTNHPLNYPANSENCWLISATHLITLSFTHFHLEENKDWLKVYDGPTTSDELLKASSNITPSSITSTTNQMLVVFTSDSSGSFSGFNATYQPYSCHFVLSSESGSFASPNFPKENPGIANCSWLINANNRTILSFREIRTDYEYKNDKNWIKVYDGPTTSSKELKLSQNDVGSWAAFVSTSNQMLVTFIGDRAWSSSGFEADYSQCNAIQIQSPSPGWIASPNHPGNYSSKGSSCWLLDSTFPSIILSVDKNVDLNIYDSLKIYDGPTQSSEVLLNNKGNNYAWSVASTNNQVLTTFVRRGFREAFTGFNITYYGTAETQADRDKIIYTMG